MKKEGRSRLLPPVILESLRIQVKWLPVLCCFLWPDILSFSYSDVRNRILERNRWTGAVTNGICCRRIYFNWNPDICRRGLIRINGRGYAEGKAYPLTSHIWRARRARSMEYEKKITWIPSCFWEGASKGGWYSLLGVQWDSASLWQGLQTLSFLTPGLLRTLQNCVSRAPVLLFCDKSPRTVHLHWAQPHRPHLAWSGAFP